MKRLAGIAIAMVLGSVTLGQAAKANAAEVINAERFVQAFQDNYAGYRYRNVTNYDKFVAAIEDGYAGYAYRNTTDYNKFVAAIGDGYTGYTYRNTTNADKFVAALEDGYAPERYASVMDSARFAGVLKEKREDEIASANDVPRCDEVKDYLTEPLVLAKLQACE